MPKKVTFPFGPLPQIWSAFNGLKEI